MHPYIIVVISLAMGFIFGYIAGYGTLQQLNKEMSRDLAYVYSILHEAIFNEDFFIRAEVWRLLPKLEKYK